MDIGTAFLLGVLVGQWVLLFAIWRAVNRLIMMLANEDPNAGADNKNIVEYKRPGDYRDNR